MTEEQKDRLYDLLSKKILYGLGPDEQGELEEFDQSTVDREFRSLEMAAASINVASLDIEPMPEHLIDRITKAAPAALQTKAGEFDGNTTIRSIPRIFTADDVFERKPRMFIFGLIGWVAAAILLILLGAQFYSGRINKQPEKAVVALPSPTDVRTPDEQREDFMRSAPDMISATWAPGNMKDAQVSGDIVWSDTKQAGFARFHGLPVNDATSTSYQLWIFDETQDKATPIDGAVFDVDSTGEAIVKVNAKLHAVKPEMFAVTLEKAGGVVVSKREKIAALAKVETQKS